MAVLFLFYSTEFICAAVVTLQTSQIWYEMYLYYVHVHIQAVVPTTSKPQAGPPCLYPSFPVPTLKQASRASPPIVPRC